MDWQNYLEYFKAMQNKEFQWTTTNSEEGILQMGYPKYDKQLLTFIREFEKSALFDKQYKKTLKSHNVKIKMNRKTINQVLEIDEQTVLQAMLTLIVTAEEVDEGSWARALQDGYLFQITDALVKKQHEG